jgi:hypothetical protein
MRRRREKDERKAAGLALGSADEGHELRAGLVASSEGAEHGGSDGRCSRLLHTAHGHALMPGRSRRISNEVRREEGGQAHVASITTATPIGRIASSIAVAICFVNRSWTCSLRENVSAIRASLESPRTNLLGM